MASNNIYLFNHIQGTTQAKTQKEGRQICDPVWQVTPRIAEMCSHEELYTPNLSEL